MFNASFLFLKLKLSTECSSGVKEGLIESLRAMVTRKCDYIIAYNRLYCLFNYKASGVINREYYIATKVGSHD